MSTGELDERLDRSIQRVLGRAGRFDMTEDEVSEDLVSAVYNHVVRSVLAPPVLAAVALGYDVPAAYLAAAVSSQLVPPAPLIAKGVAALDATVKGLDSFAEGSGQLAYELALRHELPQPIAEFARGGHPFSWAGWVDLITSEERGAGEYAESIACHSASLGCVSMIEHLIWMRRTQPRDRLAATTKHLVDRRRLNELAEWGGITLIAARLAWAGDDAAALEWSETVPDNALLYSHDQLQRLPKGWHWAPHTSACRPRCRSTDASQLGALAVIDYLCGAPDRARARAARFTSGADRQGWATAADHALATWVSSRFADPDEARAMLASVQPKHEWFGLIQAQIDSDLAAMATDAETARARRTSAAKYLADPRVRLHVSNFGYQDLLVRLPCATLHYQDAAGTD